MCQLFLIVRGNGQWLRHGSNSGFYVDLDDMSQDGGIPVLRDRTGKRRGMYYVEKGAGWIDVSELLKLKEKRQ